MIVGSLGIDDSTEQYIATIISNLKVSGAKKEGVREYLLWEVQEMRGHYEIGRKIIQDYRIEREIAELKVLRRRSGARAYRIEHHEERLEYEKKYREKNYDKLEAYKKSPSQRAIVNRRDKLKSRLYQAYLKSEKEKEHEKEKEG